MLVQGACDRAEVALRTALEGFAETKFELGRIETLTALGYVALEKGQPQRARAWFAQAIGGAEAIGFDAELADCLNGLAGVALKEGDPLRAARILGAGEELAARFGEESVAALNRRLDSMVDEGALVADGYRYKIARERVLTSNPIFAAVISP